jgi:hypothetical protein
VYMKMPEILQDTLSRSLIVRYGPSSPEDRIVDIGAPSDSSSWRHELVTKSRLSSGLGKVNAAHCCTSEMPIGLWDHTSVQLEM